MLERAKRRGANQESHTYDRQPPLTFFAGVWFDKLDRIGP